MQVYAVFDNVALKRVDGCSNSNNSGGCAPTVAAAVSAVMPSYRLVRLGPYEAASRNRAEGTYGFGTHTRVCVPSMMCFTCRPACLLPSDKHVRIRI